MKPKTTEQFIEDAKKMHGNRYDYSKAKYVNARSKAKIICPEHGEFEQAVDNHLRGRGCPDCGKDVKRKTTEQFIEDAKKVHGDKYDYSEVKYINNKSKVTIVCPRHGEFKQTPNNHLKGFICPACSKSNIRKDYEKGLNKFMFKMDKLYNGKYEFSLKGYRGISTRVKIKCPNHGIIKSNCGFLLKGLGCPECHAEKLKKLSK